MYKFNTSQSHCPGVLNMLTFTLQTLSEEAFQQLLAVLADGGSGVGVDQEGVRNFDLRQ